MKKTATKSRIVYPVSLGEEEIRSLDDICAKTGTSKAQAIREAIKMYSEEIKGVEVVKLRDISKEQARKEILDYLKKHDRAWTSDIADALDLDIILVNKILEELWREDKIEQHAN